MLYHVLLFSGLTDVVEAHSDAHALSLVATDHEDDPVLILEPLCAPAPEPTITDLPLSGWTMKESKSS